MPAEDRPGRKGVYIELPVEVLAEVRALAERNGRDFRSEVEHALRRHLAAPPTVRVLIDTPDLPSAELEGKPTTKAYQPQDAAVGHPRPAGKKGRAKKQ